MPDPKLKGAVQAEAAAIARGAGQTRYDGNGRTGILSQAEPDTEERHVRLGHEQNGDGGAGVPQGSAGNWPA